MRFTSSSELSTKQIDWIRRFLNNRMPYSLYFECSLQDLIERNIDNRSYYIAENKEGLIFNIAFDDASISTVVGQFKNNELEQLAHWQSKGELHCNDLHLNKMQTVLSDKTRAIKELLYYELTDQKMATDSRLNDSYSLQKLGLKELKTVQTFFRSHYPDTVFSEWMLDLPMIGLFSDGDLLAVGGTHVLHSELKTAQIGNFLTRPDQRGKGLAKIVARKVISELSLNHRIKRFLLGTTADNTAARRTYEGIGFQVIEIRKEIWI